MAEIKSPIPDVAAHPGLLLDKWHTEFTDDPKFVRTELQRVTVAVGDPALFATLLKRRRAALAGGVTWRSTSTSALAPHLSRAGSFENAGLCLHPLYGFAYLPGTGLKGMARAWAEFHFGKENADVLAVFGPSEIRGDEGAYTGAVIFFEAWPTKWPKLVVDIVNNHHRDYYEKGAPPEDWENPNIVNFLAVAPGTEFEFAVAARRKNDPEGERMVGLAKQWLDAALVWLGAGAKTNAGYGRFKGVGERPALPPNRELFECTLRLVSPAFLAGALQQQGDCNLRAATLRGLLRWWWRTLHAGFLTAPELQKLEGEIWGTTKRGGLIALELEELPGKKVGQWDKPQGGRFATPPGRFYLSYGMEGNPKWGTNPRFFIEPGGEWRLRIVARGDENRGAERAMAEANTALRALCTFGGVGAKCRRGYGSLAVMSVSRDLPEFKTVMRPIAQGRTIPCGPSLIHRSSSGQVDLKTTEVWKALNTLGEAYRQFALEYTGQAKIALGTPRKNADHPQRKPRHASPLHMKLLKLNGGYHVTLTALWDPYLPSLEESQEFLEKCIAFMKEDIKTNG